RLFLVPFSPAWPAAVGALLSFPTRRSSDLRPPLGRLAGGSGGGRPAESRGGGGLGRDEPPARHRLGPGREPQRLPGLPLDGPLRSEEHTSELQSRENLVCRLLLEKKKTTTM